MNHFERIAIFTTIETIETQLKGLKTMIAASANSGSTTPGTHKVTQVESLETHHELSDEDDENLTKTLELARDAEIKRMRMQAESEFQREWETTSKAMTDG